MTSVSIAGTPASRAAAAIEWTMRCVPKLGPRVSVDGVTRASAVQNLLV